MRILMDTNILFSALLYEGNERLVLEKIILERHTLVLTDLICAETRRILTKKVKKEKRAAALLLFHRIMAHQAVFIKTKHLYADFLARAHTMIHPNDVPILAAGLQPEIDALVTGDADFLSNKKIASLRGKKIMTSRELLKRLTAR